MGRRVLALVLVFVVWGCLAPAKREIVRYPPLKRTDWPSPLIDDGDRASLRTAVDRSLAYFQNKKPGEILGRSNAERELFQRTYASLVLFRKILMSFPQGEFEKGILDNFTFSEATRGGQSVPVLLTGYYEPIIEGSLQPGGEYRYPIYRRPDDLAETADPSSGGGKQIVRFEKGQFVPYYSRREIDTQGSLNGKGYELAWLKDPWERFVLHVQGSGQIRLPDQTLIRVGYAGSNGRTYRSVGRHLADQGLLKAKDISLPRIREYLLKNPEKMEEALNVNERYVFFRRMPNQEGPLGALGVPLTPGRSIATDLTFFPPGGLAYLVGRQPLFDAAGRISGRQNLRRFVINLDTGAAMKGAERVDFFCGTGEKAGMIAGHMREEGRLYFLWAKK